MNFHPILAWLLFAGFIPCVFVVLALIHFCWWRFRQWRRKTGKMRSGLYACCLAMGMAFLENLWRFYQPSVAILLDEKQSEDADEDDTGDPENLKKQLDRQLKKIRRGEPVEWLVLRL
jgi:hypothetical protein